MGLLFFFYDYLAATNIEITNTVEIIVSVVVVIPIVVAKLPPPLFLY